MCGRTGMSWRRRSTPGSRTGSRGGDDRVCLRRGEGLRSFQGGRETWKTASWQPAGSRIRLPLKESDIPVAVNPKSADGPSNNPQCGFWDSQFSAAPVKSVEQPWGRRTGLFNALYMNLIDCSAAIPPIARLYRVLATFPVRLKRRMLAANERIRAKTPGFLRIREASSAKLPSRT